MQQSGIGGATTTSVAAPFDVDTVDTAGSRDVKAEKAALSLARRRGKCAPSVDTKLADAWLGFYVALTKSSSRSTEAATQASTDAITETTMSDVGSSPGLSPRHWSLCQGGATSDNASEPLTSSTLRGESWADAADSAEEGCLDSPKKRSRRSHRRRRTRGRGKKGRGSKAGDGPEEECEPIDEEDDGPAALANVSSTAPAWPFQAAAPESNTCPKAVLASEAAPSPSKSGPLLGPMSFLCTSPTDAVQCDASARTPPRLGFGSSPVAHMMPSTPTAVHTPMLCEASARTPPRFGFSSSPAMGFGSSPMAHMMPSTPTAFGGAIHQQGQYSYQGNFGAPEAVPQGYNNSNHMMGSFAAPGSVYVASPCQGQAVPPSTFYMSTCTSGDFCTAPYNVRPTVEPTVDPMVDAMRSFLTGGLPICNNADLAQRLQAAANETYED